VVANLGSFDCCGCSQFLHSLLHLQVGGQALGVFVIIKGAVKKNVRL